MREIKHGDLLRALDPDSGDELDGRFLGRAASSEALDVRLELGIAMADAAWIELDDGTTRKVAVHQLRTAYGGRRPDPSPELPVTQGT